MILDRMNKSAHFLSVKTTNSAEDYVKFYIQEIVRLHGVLVSIISDRVHNSPLNFGSLSRKVWVQK